MKLAPFALSTLLIAPVISFAPTSGSNRCNVSLAADRRHVLGDIAKVCGVASLAGFGANQIQRPEDYELVAGLSNPAQNGWRAKPKGQSFIPGKGMHNHEDELIAGLSNPAQNGWRAKPKGQSFIPGKGMHNHEELA